MALLGTFLELLSGLFSFLLDPRTAIRSLYLDPNSYLFRIPRYSFLHPLTAFLVFVALSRDSWDRLIEDINDRYDHHDFPEEFRFLFKRCQRAHEERPEDQMKSQVIALRRKAIVQANMESSQFYRLPTEMLRLVDDHLDLAGALAIRATCLQFCIILGTAGPVTRANTAAAKAAKAQMSKWMIRQLYLRLCARERRVGGIIRDCDGEELFLCQKCAKRHPSNAFTRQQLEAGPEARTCRGRDSVLHLCEHLTVDYETVKSLRGKIECEECPKRHGRLDSATLSEQRESERWYQYIQEFYPLRGSTKPFEYDISAELACATIPSCPHVSIQDLDLERWGSQPVELRFVHPSGGAQPDGHMAFLEGNTVIAFGSCKVHRCPLRFDLQWRSCSRSVVLMVWFILKDLAEPANPRWLAISHLPKNGEDLSRSLYKR